MCKNKGQNLTELAILLAVIVVAGVVAYTLLGNNVNNLLGGSSNKYKEFNPFEFSNNQNNANNSNNQTVVNKGGDLGGTPQKPVKQCNGGNCTIDFGTFMLAGIPEKFNDFVETSGTSSAVDKMSDLLAQIADQLNKDGLTDQYLEVKRLSNLGHNLSAIQKEVEKVVNSCNYDMACIDTYKDKPFPAISNFDTSVSTYPEDYYSAVKTCVIGGARNQKYDNSDVYKKGVAGNRTAFAIVDTFDKIKADKTIPQETRNVISELTWDIGITGEDMQNNVDFLTGWYKNDTSLSEKTFFDPLTAKSKIETVPKDPVSNLQNYNASKITNFDSSLICASGEYSDSGSQCH